MALKNIYCVGVVNNDGGLTITDKGFCYSNTVNNPKKEDSLTWYVSDISNPFMAIITGLTSSTLYYVNAYAVNSLGIDYSNVPKQVTTYGISIYPVITIYITYQNIVQPIFEIGTVNSLVVSGETYPNEEEESNFINGYLNQVNPVPPKNPILQWTGFQSTYSTSDPPPLNISFVPLSSNSESWYMKHNVYYNINGDSGLYQISGTTKVDGLFPILWILKSGYVFPQSYWLPGGSLTYNYFYYECSKPLSDPTKPEHGKILESHTEWNLSSPKTILVCPYDINHIYMILGHPEYYGNIHFRVNNGPWVHTPQNYYPQNVGTGLYGSDFGIQNSWTHGAGNEGYPFKILAYKFETTYLTPIPFDIYFT
jgi:hypothetical protein